MPKSIAVERGRVRDEATTTYREQSIAKIQLAFEIRRSGESNQRVLHASGRFMVRD